MSDNQKPLLEDHQKEILKNFTLEFLPKTGNKRMYTNNEIDSITTVLEKYFFKYFGFKITNLDLLNIFWELGYKTFKKGKLWDEEAKIMRPEKNSEYWSGEELELICQTHFVYVEIRSKIIKDIQRTYSTLPKQTNKIKAEENEKLKNDLLEFSKRNKIC